MELFVILSEAIKPVISKQLIKQHPIDDNLEKQPGTIKRTRDPNFCKRIQIFNSDSLLGMCEFCMPIQPFDAKYLLSKKIKHMSFYAYLSQIRDSGKILPTSSSLFVPPLDEQDYTLKLCNMHKPYPLGICTKCQPSAITLSSQKFRMVDHLEFEDSKIIDEFIQYWRQTGVQRAGFLFGRYEPHADVPLGVKAVVSAIYEPAQDAGHDWIQLLTPDPEEEIVQKMALKLGLEVVGVIYTDLVDDGKGSGSVICKRHSNSYFLSSAECIFAAKLQNKYPVTTKYSSSQKYSSRFVTCVLSGNYSLI
jgi:nuclear protein localization family protein 4